MLKAPALSITQKGLILVALPLLSELTFVAVLIFHLRQADADVGRELKAKNIAQNVALLSKIYYSAAMDIGAFNISHSPTLRKKFESDKIKISAQTRKIRSLVEDNKKRVAELDAIADEYHILEDSMQFLQGAEKGPSLFNFKAISTDMHHYKETSGNVGRLGQRIESFMEPEIAVAYTSLRKRHKDRNEIERVIGIGIGLNVLIAIFVALYFGRSISSRINVLTDNTFRFAKSHPLNPLLDGTDEIAHLDSAFHKVVEDLARTDKMKKEVLAVVSHDLRSPLMSVQGTLTLMTSGILGAVSDKAKSKLENAEADVGRLISLINDLLDSEALDSGEMELYLRSISSTTLFERSIISVATLAEKKSISLEVKPEAHLLNVDEDRIVQVLVNLLSNAIKFSDSESKVEMTCVDLGELIELRVVDHGRGIPQDQIEKVFDRFKQVEKSDAKEKGGSGLGLYICKRIIDAHRGSIGVESELGKGSSFWFRVNKPEPKEIV